MIQFLIGLFCVLFILYMIWMLNNLFQKILLRVFKMQHKHKRNLERCWNIFCCVFSILGCLFAIYTFSLLTYQFGEEICQLIKLKFI
jgi:hypothetical protein